MMTSGAPVVVLAGGTGGAKLARGLLDEVGDDLVVIANTGDDVEIYGAHVSPDPDLVPSGWPTASTPADGASTGDTFAVMDGLARARRGRLVQPRRPRPRRRIERARRLAAGQRLTEALAALTSALGLAPGCCPWRTSPCARS
jgi:LPPG:FO 2-phospho-L-lactate transferase